MADDSKSVYFKSTSTAFRQQWKWSVVGHELSQGARSQDQLWDKLAKIRVHWGENDHSRYSAGDGKLQFMINEVPEIAYAVKKLSRQLAKPSELDMKDLKHCVRYTLGHSARQTSEARRGGNDRSSLTQTGQVMRDR